MKRILERIVYRISLNRAFKLTKEIEEGKHDDCIDEKVKSFLNRYKEDFKGGGIVFIEYRDKEEKRKVLLTIPCFQALLKKVYGNENHYYKIYNKENRANYKNGKNKERTDKRKNL